MQLTQFTDYALRTLIYVSINNHKHCTVSEISKNYHISRDHLVKVVHKLSQLKVLNTTRGHKGGIQLNGTPEMFNLGTLIEKIESHFFIVECFDKKNKECVISPVCHLKGILYEARKSFMDTLNRYTLADIIQNRHELRQILNKDHSVK